LVHVLQPFQHLLANGQHILGRQWLRHVLQRGWVQWHLQGQPASLLSTVLQVYNIKEQG
jgi:hypothetical protein